jgi:asparagine synthase (glutamine-hydrolysing)
MAFGIESRVPYVDHFLVELIARLPADLRLSQGWTKRIIRDSLADLLPPMVRSRKTKLGFSTPESKWLKGPLKPWVIQMLGEPEYLSAVVDRSGVAELLELYSRSKSSRVTEQQLFRLAVYENWARLFLGKQRSPCSKPPDSRNDDSATTYAIN